MKKLVPPPGTFNYQEAKAFLKHLQQSEPRLIAMKWDRAEGIPGAFAIYGVSRETDEEFMFVSTADYERFAESLTLPMEAF